MPEEAEKNEDDDEVNRLNRIIKDLWVMCVNFCFLIAHGIAKLRKENWSGMDSVRGEFGCYWYVCITYYKYINVS